MGGFLLLILVLICFWASHPRSARVTVTFLYTTNVTLVANTTTSVHDGAVFELVNNMDETIYAKDGMFIPADRPGLDSQPGDTGSGLIDEVEFGAGTTNIVRICVPTGRGQLKMVLKCLAESNFSRTAESGGQMPIPKMLRRWYQPSYKTRLRWEGWFYVESQPFETNP